MDFACSSGSSIACRRRPASLRTWWSNWPWAKSTASPALTPHRRRLRKAGACPRAQAIVRPLPHFCLSPAIARRLEPLGQSPSLRRKSRSSKKCLLSSMRPRQNQGTSRGRRARVKVAPRRRQCPPRMAAFAGCTRCPGAQESTHGRQQGRSRQRRQPALCKDRSESQRGRRQAERQGTQWWANPFSSARTFIRDRTRTLPFLTHLAAGLLGGVLAALVLLAFSAPRHGESSRQSRSHRSPAAWPSLSVRLRARRRRRIGATGLTAWPGPPGRSRPPAASTPANSRLWRSALATPLRGQPR